MPAKQAELRLRYQQSSTEVLAKQTEYRITNQY